MISRVAESCFWLNRYIERAETMARVVSVNRFTVLDADIHDAERWKPIILVAGEQDRFEELVGADAYDSDVAAEKYLTWSEDNSVSIRTSLYYARENARMTREVISREMWETINTSWQWFNGPAARKEYRKDRLQFYGRIRSMCAEFQGVCHNTMLHEQPFDFMRLGMMLERGGQTARIMAVKNHWLTVAPRSALESPRESAQWAAILRLCAAIEPFYKRNRSAPTGPLVAQFLLQQPVFPRSVRHCFERTLNFLTRVEKDAGRRKGSTASAKLVTDLVRRLKAAKVEGLDGVALREELATVIDAANAIGEQITRDFFEGSRAVR